MSENQKPIYVNGVFVKRVEFQNGGSVMNVFITADGLKNIQAVQRNHGESDGSFKLIIAEMKSPLMSKADPNKVAATHSVKVDQWKPSAKPSKPQPESDPFA